MLRRPKRLLFFLFAGQLCFYAQFGKLLTGFHIFGQGDIYFRTVAVKIDAVSLFIIAGRIMPVIYDTGMAVNYPLVVFRQATAAEFIDTVVDLMVVPGGSLRIKSFIS